jgi:hypothetical protein
VVEEMLAGLGEVKVAVEQAIAILTDLIEEAKPEMVPHLQEVLDRTLLQPLTAHSAAVEQLQVTLASRVYMLHCLRVVPTGLCCGHGEISCTRRLGDFGSFQVMQKCGITRSEHCTMAT